MSAPEAAAGGPAVEEVPGRRPRRRLAAVVLVVLVALAGVVLGGRLGGAGQQESALLGGPAPGLAGPTLEGGSFDLADWDGEVVLVNVWASWCAPCRREQPLLVAADQALGPRGLRIVGIDVRDRADDARTFLAEHGGAPWPNVVDPDGERAVEWGTFALPETYLVGRDGTVVAKASGELEAAWIDEHVVPLLTADGAP
ncbi:cytochrome c biogenesis protein CcmG, thiol:disulfide interchange protein DsbE [Blastococcus sp. DSM 46786]|uniref:TlpA family protein disulfide reductase n=1 Tax=Blastococcus sp. DSM 46786 TaxID=1798227 RepID=UPI0008ACD446|nr:TlpA disulfide reductase family protein [Blastococcus sp. DSM 46786]SEK68725.1 cytochrome c biogenesis protein CcmG, thiol:disulfide interchange protein DsbE [Blastococcus sp. DSM 46786]